THDPSPSNPNPHSLLRFLSCHNCPLLIPAIPAAIAGAVHTAELGSLGSVLPPARFSLPGLYRSPKSHTRARVSASGIAFVIGASPTASGGPSPPSLAPPRAPSPSDVPSRAGRRGGSSPAGSMVVAHPAAAGPGGGQTLRPCPAR
uniref:Uncharacterized protein n=1 Tax=Triticum urartu TaxID=4572 RepID=A0A8R7JV04_TRIUA